MLVLLLIFSLVPAGLKCESPIPPQDPPGHFEASKFEPHVFSKIDEQWRLPLNLSPLTYSIQLLPFFEDRDFLTQGYVQMLVRCNEATNDITFNVADMTINRDSISVLRSVNNLPINIREVIEDVSYEKYTIRTESTLVAGSQYTVSMNFTYTLADSTRGFFRDSYVENGVTKWLAATQFEAPSARKAFPCFDDPGMKANFYITLGRKEGWTALSNTRVRSTIPNNEEPGYVWDIFEGTVKMPTYLVAFVVSEFQNLPSDTGLSNVEFRIWSRPDAIYRANYAADIGPRISEFFESYFQIEFPLPKQDMVAVPRFGGAMENWGLIIYGESSLLYDPDVNTASFKYNVAEIIAHELAHQWTGNWVTCVWWNVIWLNEGFAQFFEYYGLNGVQPELKPLEQFPVRTLHPTLIYDSVPTRPINIPVASPAESSAMFDTITYDKGACIIRMMADFLGEETFRRGMNLYMTRMAYGSADQDDLFTALNDQVQSDGVSLPGSVKSIMDTWTFQMGYPLVTITRDYGNGQTTIKQERFLRVPSDDTTPYQWVIPVTYRVGDSDALVWISELESTQSLGGSSDQWILVNVNQMGYYRVKYDDTNYGLLRDQLQTDHTQIPVNSRAQLLDDSFNLALAARISYIQAMDFTLYLGKEQSYSPWEAVLEELNYIDSMFANDPSYGSWKSYVSGLITPYFDFVGFNENPDDEHLRILSRSQAIQWSCKLDVDQCVNNAIQAYSEWMASPPEVEVISRNQKTTILCAGIRKGGELEWEFAYDRFLNPATSSERTPILNSLGCTEDLTLLNRMLDLMINRPEGVSTSDGVAFFNGVANNIIGNSAAFNFLRNRWDDLLPDYSGSMASFFRTVSTKYNTQAQLTDLLALRDEHLDILGSAAAVTQAIATVEANIQWMATSAPVISNWLSQ